jgi:hypothetical protein
MIIVINYPNIEEYTINISQVIHQKNTKEYNHAESCNIDWMDYLCN